MKLTVSQETLLSALQAVGRAVNSRTTLPVLSNVLLATDGEQLKLSATNREIAIACWIDAEIEKGGSTTSPARLLTDFVGSLPNASIDLVLKPTAETLSLKSGKFSANIKGITPDEYPLISPIPADLTAIEFTPSQLRRMIDSVTFAASTDENQPTLAGVCIDGSNDITLAATDGFRLSVVEHVTDDVFGSVIVPARTLNEVARVAVDAESMSMYIGERVYFSAIGKDDHKWRRVEIESQIIDAKYPQDQATIPQSWTTKATVDIKSLIGAVKVAQLFGRDSNNIIRVAVGKNDNGGFIQLAATSAESGDSINDIAAEVDGPNIEIAFNGKLMMDALSVLATYGDSVVVELTQPTRPGVFYAVGKRSEFYHIIIPMHPPRQ